MQSKSNQETDLILRQLACAKGDVSKCFGYLQKTEKNSQYKMHSKFQYKHTKNS